MRIRVTLSEYSPWGTMRSALNKGRFTCRWYANICEKEFS